MEHCAFGNRLLHQHKAQGADSPSTPTPRPRGRRTRLISSFTRAACPPTPRMHRPRSPSYLGDDAECPVEGPGQALLRCSAFSTGRNPTSVADRKAFWSHLTGIRHMYMRRSWYPPTSEARKTELQPESPESQRFPPRQNWAPPSHGGDSTSSDVITTMKCSRQRITYPR